MEILRQQNAHAKDLDIIYRAVNSPPHTPILGNNFNGQKMRNQKEIMKKKRQLLRYD